MPTLELVKWGNSTAVRLPIKILNQLHLSIGDDVFVSIDNGNLVLKPVKQTLADKLFKHYDNEKSYPNEIVNRKPIGHELG